MTNQTELGQSIREVGLSATRRMVAGATVYTGKLSRENPSDLISLRLKRRSRVSPDLSKLTAGLELQWLNGNGKALGRSQTVDASSPIPLKQTLKPGTYYLKLSSKANQAAYRLSLTTRALPAPPQRFTEDRLNRFARQVTKLTNDYRRGHGLSPLKLNPALSAIAQSHSQDMATNDFFDHYGSNGSSVFDRYTSAGYAYSSGGENIAAGFLTPKSVVNAWINSPGHRANLLTAEFKEVGVGFVYLPSDPGKLRLRYYWTQDFGVPAS